MYMSDLINAIRYYVTGALASQVGSVDNDRNGDYINDTVDLVLKYMQRERDGMTPGAILDGRCSDFQCWIVPMAARVFYHHFTDYT